MIKKYKKYYLKKVKKLNEEEEDRIIDDIFYDQNSRNWVVAILNYDESYHEHDWEAFGTEESMQEWLEKNIAVY